MERRRFLALASAGAVSGLAGCSGGNSTPTATPDRMSLGQSVTVDGLEFTIAEYTLADRFFEYGYHYNHREYTDAENQERVDRADENDWTYPSIAGGQLMFVRIVAENVGDSRVVFPSSEDMWVTYNGEETEGTAPRGDVYGGERSFRMYSAVTDEDNAARNGAYSGYKIDAWMAFEVPVKFEPSKTTIHVQFNDGEETIEMWNPNDDPE